ncbi:hypothetical protein R1T08_33740 [Streptomyces sp. SBC-4]|nr:hypothetical protein [Streptomyces sp. SBC-4]MDV5148980.1 hypothetical protein [Streptomyces sp. SBC-4]
MNLPSEPLQCTVHEVLGRLVQLDQAGTPQRPVSAHNDTVVRSLGAGSLREAIDAAQAISRAWRPAAQEAAFAWRGLVGCTAQAVVSEASSALTSLDAAISRRPFAAPQDAPASVRGLRQSVRAPGEGLPHAPQVPGDGQLPDGIGAELRQLADLFGMPQEAASPGAAFALCELADLTSADHRPPRACFDSPGLAQAHAATAELRQALTAEAEARAAAEDLFGDQVLGEADCMP